MRVLVAVTEEATLEDGFEIENDAIEDRDLTYTLNEWDAYAVEEALSLAEAGVVDEVVAVTIGPERAEESIRMALARGVDRGIRVWDEALEAAELLAVSTKTDVLCAIVEREGPELVLTGVQTGDDGFAATGVSLAAAAGYGWAAVVTDLWVDDVEDVARVHRELEEGVVEVTDVELPAVLTIQTGINDPRYASLRGMRLARDREIERPTLGDLDLEATDVEGSIRISALRERESERKSTILGGSTEEAVSRLASVLREEGVWRG